MNWIQPGHCENKRQCNLEGHGDTQHDDDDDCDDSNKLHIMGVSLCPLRLSLFHYFSIFPTIPILPTTAISEAKKKKN